MDILSRPDHPMGVEHSGEAFYGCRSHNAKLFNELRTLVSGNV